MSEEQACLVRARSDSESSAKLCSFGTIHAMAYTEDRLNSSEGAGEPAPLTNNAAISPPDIHIDGNESGELLDYNDASVLEQFHEDALRQAGCGLSQLRVLLACSLALAGAALELSAIPFILPSAEIEMCILPHQKNWLVVISVVGWSLGSAAWGCLAARLGRRRALVSAVAVNAVFATIAAFMPTYGTFMMARFCSAIGSGGIAPLSYTYTSESVNKAWKRAAIGLATASAGAGSMLAAALAATILPHTGAETLAENKEHFSAWHRYLLLCTLPILASLVSLIWTQESPRYLLDVGREVDAMMVYQTIHSSNQSKACGAGRSEYRLDELSLPGKRRPATHNHVTHSLKQFWQAFYQIFSSPYRRPTLCLAGSLVFAVAIQFYLSAYIPSKVLRMENEVFDASTQTVNNLTFDSQFYNKTIENIEYNNCAFKNCTFRDLLMSHVTFTNCSFVNSALANIKSSNTWFRGVTFVHSTIIDTDMEAGREFDEFCIFDGSTVRGMQGGCGRHADLTSNLGGLVSEQTYVSHAMLVAAVFALMPLSFRQTALAGFCLSCVLLSPALYIADTETMLYLLEAAFRLEIALVYLVVTLHIVTDYPANLRCTAHGLILSVVYMTAAVVRGAAPGAGSGALAACVCALLGVCALACALTRR